MPKRHILIIDDVTMIRKMVRKTLEDADYEVRESSDGEEGLKALEEAPVDLVITDIIMPVMEGIETIIEIRRRFPDTRILAISSGGTGKNVNLLGMARRLGAQGTLAKPFTHETLLATVRQMLEDKP
jgi:CheY-like chemotaxis protein